MKAKDLVGTRFGRLVALRDIGSISNGQSAVRLWECKCDCGNVVQKRSSQLLQGNVQSCGCLKSEVCRNKVLLPAGESGFNALFRSYIQGAKRRDLLFDIPKTVFRELTSANCFYCGTEPNQSRRITKGLTNYMYNGVDRYDNNHGYTMSNCVTCCHTCNYLKSDMNGDDFCNLIKKIYNNLQARK